MSKRKEPLEIFVKVLLQGGRLSHEGYEYAMADDGSLCVVFSTDTDEEKLIAVDYTLREIKKLADDIGFDNLWLAACAMQLQSLR